MRVTGEGNITEPSLPAPATAPRSLPPPPPTGAAPPAVPADSQQPTGHAGTQPPPVPGAESQPEGPTPPPPPPRGNTLPPAIPPRRCDKQPAPAQSSQQPQYISATTITVSRSISYCWLGPVISF